MVELRSNTFPVLLAGGSGTRLWPVSRELHPKQLVKFFGNDSLIQSTIKRLLPALAPENIRVVCGREHALQIARHMREAGVDPDKKVICEPCGRNTAPAILLAVLMLRRQKPDAVVCVFPADHVIRNVDAFHRKLASAAALARMGHIVTFGIKPDYPETGYGYIEGEGELPEQAMAIKRFVEKPDAQTAAFYLESGRFFWNSGMFAFKASEIIREFELHHPELLSKMEAMDLENSEISADAYEQLPNISIDYAVMEKTRKGAVLPSDFGWSDIGSWKSLYDFTPKDPDGNVVDGDVIAEGTRNCFIMGQGRLVATNNVEDLVVVETPDSVFVSDMENSRDVKLIVNRLKEKGRNESLKHPTVHHSWGTLTVLDDAEGFTTTKKTVFPGATVRIEAGALLSKRLVVAKGRAKATTNDRSRVLEPGQSLTLAEKQFATLENTTRDPVTVIEVQIGRP